MFRWFNLYLKLALNYCLFMTINITYFSYTIVSRFSIWEIFLHNFLQSRVFFGLGEDMSLSRDQFYHFRENI